MLSNSEPFNDDLSPDVMIPDLIRIYPAARVVLDKYGLKGCGGPEGPYESIRFFARAHEVDERTLLCELEAVVQRGSASPESPQGLPPEQDVADTIYRRYFLAGILVVASFGATWGAWLLLRIAADHSFTGLSINEINAHAQAQVFGWMGLFIMGFAYQAFPRFWRTNLVAAKLSIVTFWTMLTGIVAASIGLSLGGHWQYALPVATLGSLLELIAVSVFTGHIFVTFKHSGKRMEPYIAFIFTALAWFVVSTAFNLWHVWNTLSAGSNAQLALDVAVFQPPLRDMQFHGLGMTMVLGVSIRTLPHIFGLPKVGVARAWVVLVLLTTAVIAEVSLSFAYQFLHNETVAILLVLPYLMLLIASLILIDAWKLWRPFSEPDRSTKFIQSGYAWLILSLSMLLFLPIHQALSHAPASHAYLGATRHAITVGFISMLIMGHAAKVVATLNGVRPDRLPALWGPWWLVNIGCLSRVVAQIFTGVTKTAYPALGVSGTLEVVGLAWWGWHLAGIMIEGRRLERRNAGAASQPVCPYPITADTKVADVLYWYPKLIAIFALHGFTAISNPVMRNTVARHVSIKQACSLQEINLEDFLRTLNNAANENECPPTKTDSGAN